MQLYNCPQGPDDRQMQSLVNPSLTNIDCLHLVVFSLKMSNVDATNFNH